MRLPTERRALLACQAGPAGILYMHTQFRTRDRTQWPSMRARGVNRRVSPSRCQSQHERLLTSSSAREGGLPLVVLLPRGLALCRAVAPIGRLLLLLPAASAASSSCSEGCCCGSGSVCRAVSGGCVVLGCGSLLPSSECGTAASDPLCRACRSSRSTAMTCAHHWSGSVCPLLPSSECGTATSDALCRA